MTLTRKIPKEAESRIIALVQSGKFTMKDIALGYNTSPRTIQRIINKAGMGTTLPRMTSEQAKMIAMLEERGMTPEQLNHWLQMPAFTPENIQEFLNSCTKEELSKFFYISALVKIGELAVLTSQEAKDAKPAEPQ